jgi:diaminopimelate decarboxylase
MSLNKMPFTKDDLEKIASEFPTPFHIYDEKAIRENAHDLLKAFEWNEGFKEYFAVKATPNPFILKILKSKASETDCSSLPELLFFVRTDRQVRHRSITPGN